MNVVTYWFYCSMSGVTKFDTSTLGSLLPDYYKSVFPFKPYTKWITYGKKPTEYFSRREFAFILDGDVHLRYRSFLNEHDFERDLCRVAPHKLDLGAVYNHQPKEHKSHSDFNAVERELVFDIDLTDYDNVRNCCKEAKVCALCWSFVAFAVKAMDAVLADHFGFGARLWVFSGRRGVHCWIGDSIARQLSNTARSAVAEYMSLIAADKLSLGKCGGPRLHPVAEQAYRTAMDSGLADKMVIEQKWLDDENIEKALALLDDTSDTKETLRKEFEKLDTPDLRWKALKRRFDESERRRIQNSDDVKLPMIPADHSRHFLKRFVLWNMYPRLDVNVSTGVNHLLKSPFCIHPKTGNVAVPLDVDKIEEFDLDRCPRIDRLVKEVSNAEGEENRKMLGYKHTSLAPYVETFERFVSTALNLN